MKLRYKTVKAIWTSTPLILPNYMDFFVMKINLCWKIWLSSSQNRQTIRILFIFLNPSLLYSKNQKRKDILKRKRILLTNMLLCWKLIMLLFLILGQWKSSSHTEVSNFRWRILKKNGRIWWKYLWKRLVLNLKKDGTKPK